jgi:arylsulfatase A-like enzyme
MTIRNVALKGWILRIASVCLVFVGYPSIQTQAFRQEQAPPPNILLIVLDDFGYNDLGANGNSRAPTPNLDALAAQGTRYTRHYADATCSVARAALMTGTFPAVYGFRPNHLGLSVGTPTIASALRDAGYRTQHIGKWHIVSATLDQSPSQLGFDDWFGFLHNNELGGPSADGIRYRSPTYRNPWLRDNQAPLVQYSGHLTNILTKKAISFLDQQQGQSQPWFLNLWYFAPHAPIQPDAEFKKKYPDTPEGNYHALLDQLDFNIGKVMAALASNGQVENTLVILLSDNGGTNKETDNNFPFKGAKAEFSEGGLRTPLLMRWPDHIDADAVSDELVSLYDIFPTIVQASGAKAPGQLIGRSLLDPQREASPQLFWEYSNSQYYIYSVLSSDGRWLLSNYLGLAALFDLNSDPGNSENHISQHPEIASKLTQDFLQWRKKVRNVTTDYEPRDEDGHAILRGDDVQRTPGYSGFTFAIGVTPSMTSNTPQVIAEQVGRWRLETNGKQELSLEILGQVIKAPGLPLGQCSEIVVSSQFNISPVQWKSNSSIIDLYVNGERANSITKKLPELNTFGYSNPTFIGMNASGQELFQGKLSRPLILNERIVPDAEGIVVGNGISGVPSTCTNSKATL